MAEHNPLRMKAEAYLARASQHGAPLLRLMRMPAAPVFPPGNPLRTAASGKPRILVVEGDPIVPLVSHVLAQECRIQTVPATAWLPDRARHPEQRPDLILLAMAHDGLERCRQLKADEATRSIPVMLALDGDHAADEARAFAFGADDCISRPFQPEVVEARIRNQLRLKRRHDLLERHANQDSLTGVANRRCFDLTLDAEWRRAMRKGEALALVMVDVDCFKQFNDVYGHHEGDRCLRRVAQALSRALTRPGDLLARYGGEEFVALLPGTDLDGAHWMGERLRQAVADLAIPQQRPDGAGQVTISVGCASLHPGASLAGDSLLQAADGQLYQAKHSGRNCVR